MNWDSRLDTLGVKYQENPNAKWKLNAAVYQNEQESGGNHNVYFSIQDEQGAPRAGVPCFVDWIGRDAEDPPTRVLTDGNGQTNVPIYANLDIHKLNGPYFAYVEGIPVSDQVTGMGLPEHHHVNYVLTFGPKQTTPPPPPPPPPPTQTLEDAAMAAAKTETWMPVNNTAALWLFAKAHGLQDQQTNEITFMYNGDQYIVQVFHKGIIYAKLNDWGNIKIIPK